MTGKKMPLGRLTYLGSLPATDPRHQSGWNFISGKNLSPPSRKPSAKPAAPNEEPLNYSQARRGKITLGTQAVSRLDPDERTTLISNEGYELDLTPGADCGAGELKRCRRSRFSPT